MLTCVAYPCTGAMLRPENRDRRGETTPTPFSFPHLNIVFTPTSGVKRHIKTSYVMTTRKESKSKNPDLKKLMKVDEIKSFIRTEMPKTFSAHQFIIKLVEGKTKLYGNLLCKYKNVTITQMVIGKYLSNYQRQLGIKQGKKIPSPNILQKHSKCAIWIQTEKQ